jgi:hypothetical protein
VKDGWRGADCVSDRRPWPWVGMQWALYTALSLAGPEGLSAEVSGIGRVCPILIEGVGRCARVGGRGELRYAAPG